MRLLRLYLPPNLAAGTARDAIALRLEIDLSTAPDAQYLPALAAIQRICGTAHPPKFFQVTRTQLRELVAALADQPVFFWANAPSAPIPWVAGKLQTNVSLAEPAPTVAAEGEGKKSAAGNPLSVPGKSRGVATAPPSKTSSPLLVDGSEHFLAITPPAREDPRYARLQELLKSAGFVLEPATRKWWLRDRHRTLNFLAANWGLLREQWGADFTENFAKRTAQLQLADIRATAETLRNGEIDVSLALHAGEADDVAVRQALAEERNYISSGNKIFLVPPKQIAALTRAHGILAGSPDELPSTRRSHRVNPAAIGEVADLLEEISPGFEPPETWRERSAALENISGLAPAPLSPELNSQLRPYQRLGVAWMVHLYRHNLAGILADEMGLGKTLQAIALLTAAPHIPTSGRGADRPRPALVPGRDSPAPDKFPRALSLVVCPASLLENWRREFLRFAPHLQVLVHHGERRSKGTAFAQADVVITSYGTLTRDREFLSAAHFDVIIADEAQHVKNRRSQNAAALRSLKSRGRFLLTGTPLENSLDDLRSLFEFLLPGYLERVPPGLRAEQRSWYDERLRAKTARYILRRTKISVAPELPEKLEQILWCEMGAAQASAYRKMEETSEREIFDLTARGASENTIRFAALTQLLRLRQIACDPRLVQSSREDLETSEANFEAENGKTPSAATTAQLPEFADSTKLDALRELLDEAIDDGHRLLIFSQFTQLLALVREDLESRGLEYCYLDGSMRPAARQAEVDRFQASSEIPVFLLSLKAGGTGLNLTGADTVVHLDPWWNPAAEAQATDRAHRIGQTRAVTSYKLIASGTVEEKVLALQESKRALLADVFAASDAAAAKISLSDLKSLLAAAG